MKQAPRLLISGGGTGGHIFPALAIANALKEKYPEALIEFVGAKGRMEMEKVPAEGYTIHGLWISGLNRKLWSIENVLLPFKLISSLWRSMRIVRRFKPDITVGVGGYASGPLNYTASLMGIPLLLQEQNSYPGITNKLLKTRAKKICVAYQGMERFFPADKLVLTGNPIRQSLLNLKLGREEAAQHFKLDPQKSTVLLMGGSLGPRTINKSVEEFLTNVPEDVQLLWQTGASYSEEEGNFEWGKRIKFIRRMDLAYSLADVVISRAGALSISELCAIGKACIFVPSPNVTEDHQTRNAMNLVERGAALMCRDQDARTQLMEMSIRLLRDEEKRKELVHANRSMGKPNATEDILKELEALLGNV